VPESTWIATSAPISYVGATPVFGGRRSNDVVHDRGVARKMPSPKDEGSHSRDLYGGMPDMDGIRRIAEQYAIAVVEDAAEAIGSTYGDRRAGSFGDTSVFSFHGSKTLRPARRHAGHRSRGPGRANSSRFEIMAGGRGDTMFRNREIGFKYKMTPPGGARSARSNAWTSSSNETTHLRLVQGRALGRSEVALKCRTAGTATRTGWSPRSRSIFGVTKEAIVSSLREAGVDSRPFFYPLSSLEAYAGLPGARDAARRNPSPTSSVRQASTSHPR